jgi:FkbM family methyltransferase
MKQAGLFDHLSLLLWRDGTIHPRLIGGSLMPRPVLEAAFRRQCRPVLLGPDRVLCRVLGHFKMVLDPRDSGLAPHLLLDGYWEWWVTRFLAQRVRRGMVAADVGAHAGYFSLLMASLVGPAGRLHAVEPNPAMAALLAENLSINGFTPQARLHQAAAAAQSGAQLRFVVDPTEPKNGRILFRRGKAQPSLSELAVTALALDDLPEARIDVMKIDVEGAEAEAWAGMQGLLARSPGILLLMEFNARRLADPRALLAAIAARFPLRELTDKCEIRPVEAAALLDRPLDTMLMLTNA